MSLSERSSGILETHVTWRDIEEEMQKALGTTATFGEKKSARNIGVGNGFMSRMCLIDPDWQNGESEKLPKTFVAKICSQLTMIDFSVQAGTDAFTGEKMLKAMELVALKAHNVEVSVYDLLNRYTKDDMPLVRIYGTRKFSEENRSKGYIVMDHLDELEPVHIIDNLEADDIRQALRGAAVMEAVSLGFTDDEKKKLHAALFADVMGPVFTPEMIAKLVEQMRNFDDERLEARIQKFEAIAPVLLSRENLESMDKLAESMGTVPVLCHGDMWSTNMLWSKKDGKMILRAIIDFQISSEIFKQMINRAHTAHMGSPAVDLARLFCANLSGKDRREQADVLMAVFYGYMREIVTGEMPFTLEQLRLSYDRVFPYAAFMVVPTILPMLEYLSKHSIQERKEVSTEQIMEKVISLLDDMVEMYEKNKEAMNKN